MRSLHMSMWPYKICHLIHPHRFIPPIFIQPHTGARFNRFCSYNTSHSCFSDAVLRGGHIHHHFISQPSFLRSLSSATISPSQRLALSTLHSCHNAPTHIPSLASFSSGSFRLCRDLVNDFPRSTISSTHPQYPTRHFSSLPPNDNLKNNNKIGTQNSNKGLLKYIAKYVIKPGYGWTVWGRAQLYHLLRISFTYVVQFVKHPSIVFTWSKQLKDGIIHGWSWTKRGFKLFGANFKISLLLLKKKIKGQPLNFREHKLLVQTTSDIVKLVPFSFFIVVPFAELLLPIALWIFPGMLPSTFADKQIDKPGLQRKLKAKQELAQFFQEIVAERTRQVLDKATSERSRDRAQALKEFQEKLIIKAREESKEELTETEHLLRKDEVNPFLSLKETLLYAKLFREEFKLDNLPTKALMVVCKMLGLQPYNIRANIILQLRHHILRLQREDREILWEGVDSLTHEELVEACKERAMRFYGVSDEMMRDQMGQWLALSSHQDIPPLLLLWSRSITMTHSLVKPEEAQESRKEKVMEKKEAEPVIELVAISEEREQIKSDELLPVVEQEEEKSFKEKIEEERREREEELKEKLQKADKRLEELRSEVEILQEDARGRKERAEAEAHQAEIVEPVGTVFSAERPEEILKDKAQPFMFDNEEHRAHGNMSRLDRVHYAKDELLRRCEKLEAEMLVMRTVSDMQYKQVDTVIKILAGLIDEYRVKEDLEKKEINGTRVELLVGRLEKILMVFEADAREISQKLESAKCLRLSGEDQAFYPSDSETEAETKQMSNDSYGASEAERPNS